MAGKQYTLDTKKLDAIIRNCGQPVDTRIVHDGIEYGIHQEFTKSGHPSLRPAWERVIKDLPDAIGAAVEGGVSIDDVLAKAAFDIQTLWAADVNVDTGAYKNSIKVSKE